MISAAQIREACALLGWTPPTLARRALLCFDEVWQALDDTGAQRLGGLQLGAIRGALEAAGVDLIRKNGEGAVMRLQVNGSAIDHRTENPPSSHPVGFDAN
ncbi:MAG: hypothetical protein ACRYGP_10575 [Janthinobacterium lividum]